MNKTTFILLITLIISYINTAYIQAQTQRVTVQGSILEKDTQFPVEQATIQLLSLPDSNYIKGISSLEQGKFSLTTLPGRFLLKISLEANRTCSSSSRVLTPASLSRTARSCPSRKSARNTRTMHPTCWMRPCPFPLWTPRPTPFRPADIGKACS